jgi:PAS domain S-box-containing protein
MSSRPDNKNNDNAARPLSEDPSHLHGELPASYEEVFALVPVACVITRLADGLILAVNDEWCALTGIARAVALGSTSTQLGIWRDSEHRSRFLAAREDLNQLYALRAADGDQRMVRIRTRVLRARGTELLVVSLTRGLLVFSAISDGTQS